MEKDAFGNKIKKGEIDRILADSYDEADTLRLVEEMYETIDQDERLLDAVLMLNMLPNMNKFSLKQIRLFNLFGCGDTQDILEFFDVDNATANENGFEEYIFTLLGESSKVNLSSKWNSRIINEVLALVDVNKEFFRKGDEKKYTKLLREIKEIPNKDFFKNVEEYKKTYLFLISCGRYIKYYNESCEIENEFDIEERYWHTQGWKLVKKVSIVFFKKNRDTKFFWEERNKHGKKNELHQLTYYKSLLDDLDKYEREIRKLSIKPRIYAKTKGYIINYYKISLWAMLCSSGYDSSELAIMIINKQLSFENESEKYIREGIEALKVSLTKKERIPNPEDICKMIGLTEAKAKKNRLNLLRLDSEPISEITKYKRANGQNSRKEYKDNLSPVKNPKKQELVNQIGELNKSGKTFPQIAEIVDLSEKTVFNYNKIFKEQKMEK